MLLILEIYFVNKSKSNCGTSNKTQEWNTKNIEKNKKQQKLY